MRQGPHLVWFLAVRGGVVVGGLRLSPHGGPTAQDVTGESVTVQEQSVDPAHHRTGLGSGLLEAAADWTRGRPHLPQTLSLGVEVDNVAALALYAKLGYAVVTRDGAPVTFAGGNGRPCHVLAKRTAP